ncbi:hypothetical protein CCICO_08360 [Corynebacterium ciconiae DSM 44920]|uniref:hypothetical protein n=1 Tax=Corynebacterium ciconiae TaxID=227319 RepID=UPI00037AD2E7|nr:hypothetical protein [Corynebacterium ciconiae]WKD61687.1 hypothetical protein CCICO_08360 [Corynebacterium ciconiae DSM 44920]
MRLTPRPTTRALTTAVLGTTAVLLAGCGGSNDSAPDAAGSTATVTATETEVVDADTSTSTKPAKDEPRSEEDYLRYTPVASTSELFAKNVRDAFATQWVETGNTEVSIEAMSPVTMESYTLKCSGDHVVRCTGGNDAEVMLYDSTVKPGEDGAADFPQLGDDEPQTISGVVHYLDGDEFLDTYGEIFPFGTPVTSKVLFIELDEPSVVRGMNIMNGTQVILDQTYRVGIGNNAEDAARTNLAGKDGEHVTLKVSPSQCWWPNDPVPPGWALRCDADV